MNKKLLTLIALIAGSLLLLNSCEDDDDYSTDGNNHLQYSTDTLAFEPLITTQLTSTRVLKVYNKSGKNLKIDNIELKSSRNDFQINVDGQTGTKFSNLKIKDNDSLYIFVRADINKNNTDSTILITDSIEFDYNGNKDKVILSALTRDANILTNYTVNKDTTWTNSKPFLIFDSLKIAKGATLKIEEGTEILFHNGATLTVDGTLNIKGTVAAPVLLGGDRYDHLTSGIPYLRLSNQWGGIKFTQNSTNNVLIGTIIRSSTFGIVIDSAATEDNTYRLTIGNSEIKTSSDGILTSSYANVSVYNSVLANGGPRTLWIKGGKSLFNQCTIANYSSGNRYNGAVVLKGGEQTQITFNNCIVYGSFTNEIEIDNDTKNYTFSHCLIKDEIPTDTSKYNSCYWNMNPDFTIKASDLYYNYEIDSISGARKIGDKNLLIQYPETSTDLNGNNRLQESELPDAGAYAWIRNQN